MDRCTVTLLQEVTDNLIQVLWKAFVHTDRSQRFDDAMTRNGLLNHLGKFLRLTQGDFSEHAMTDVGARQGHACGFGHRCLVVPTHTAVAEGPTVDQPLCIKACAVHGFDGLCRGLRPDEVEFLLRHWSETLVLTQFWHVAQHTRYEVPSLRINRRPEQLPSDVAEAWCFIKQHCVGL